MTEQKKADQNLREAGAYGRTVDRWWAGFYTDYKPPTVTETAEMTPAEILNLIMTGSRRG